MRKQIASLIIVLFLIVSFPIAAFTTTPFFLPRSQGEDSARWIAGWVHQGNRFDIEPCKYGSFAIIPEYTQTFKPDNIERFLFGEDLFDNCQNPFIKISGSRVSTRNNEKEWLADYFGLPTDFQSIVHFNPTVKNFIIDFEVYLGLNQWIEGAYINVSAPVVWTQWFLDVQETVIEQGAVGYDAGYFTSGPVPRSVLLNNFKEFASLEKAPTLPDGISFCPLENAMMAPTKQKKFGIADLHFAIGYNFLLAEDYHLGLNARMVVPTGTRPRGKLLFEPMIGNGHFFEMGVGISTHAVLWRDEACQKEFGFCLEAWITHMFNTQQIRSFDLKGADNSRYMLAQLMTRNITDQLNGDMIIPNDQFNKVLTPLANITTLPVKVSVLQQADVSVLFNYKGRNWEFDFGYNFWTRKPETVEILEDSECNLLNQFDWGVKGDAQLFGFRDGDDFPVPLSATQNNATVTGGFNFPERTLGEGITNPRIDNPKPAFSDITDLMAAPGGVEQINTSIQPKILSTKDLAPCRSSTHGVSNGIFGHLNYTWWSDDCWYVPYFGFGGKIELCPEKPDKSCPTLCTHNPIIGPSPCGTCDDESLLQTGLSQWCIWLKGGLTFN